MRSLILLGVVAACGGGGEGVILTLRALDGPAAAARLEVVLASADQDKIGSAEQRKTLDSLAEVSVRYYRQRATAGKLESVAQLDGFVLRIEPNTTVADDKAFVPFVIAYDAGDHVIAIGAVVDDAGVPQTIAVSSGRIEKYVVEMAALEEADDLDVTPGASVTVSCVGLPTSGLAWQPARGPQLRLLLPDTRADAEATDASARAVDRDCDEAEANRDDCDDLRPELHPDQSEECDGVDSNCDGSQLALEPCMITDGTCGADPPPGVMLCEDRDGGLPGTTCIRDPRCQCLLGPCTRCVVAFRPTSERTVVAPCAPAIGRLKIAGCLDTATCVVEVLPPTTPAEWEALISADPTNGFARQATVGDGELLIKLKLETSDLPAQPSQGVAAVHLGVSRAGTPPITIDIAVELAAAATTDCPEGSNGDSIMQCTAQ